MSKIIKTTTGQADFVSKKNIMRTAIEGKDPTDQEAEIFRS